MNAEQLSQMQHMLSGCLLPDNAQRKAAEAVITQHLNEHREVFIYGLIKLVRTSPESQVRVLAAIILRQTLPQGEPVLFTKLSQELQQGIKVELLQAILHEPERYVRSQISDTVASLASVLIYRNDWPELFPALYGMCLPTQANDALKVCALGIVSRLSDAADNLLPQIPQLHAVLLSTLPAPNSLAVRDAACVACCKIIPVIEEKAHTREYQRLVPLLLQALNDSLVAEEEDSTKRILAGLTEVATEEGKFFEKDLDRVVAAMYAIGADTAHRDLDDGSRQYACEVLIGMAESAPAMARKSTSFVRHAILVCLSLMLCVEEDPEWGNKQDSTDFYDNSNFDCGEMNMDRLALVVKGAKLWPILYPILQQFVGDKDNWRMRHAGLFALAQTCAVVAFERLPIKEVCAFVRDPHPRVRYAVMQCLGQFPVDFEVVMQTKWHQEIFPALMIALQDTSFPRLQAHAASALLNTVDGTEPKILKPYLAPLMELLITLLHRSPQMVQEQVMPAMAALAGQAPAQFTPYYARVMPLLKQVILHANSRPTRRLRAKAMESASFIGMFCGKELFQQDARDIMQMFINIQQAAEVNANQKKARKAAGSPLSPAEQAESSEDDYSEQHMLQAWSRICTCLGQEFVPVLQFVMPRVFEAITKQSESEEAAQSRVHKLTSDEDGEGQDEEDNVDKHGRVKTLFGDGDANGASRMLQVDDRPSVLMYTSTAHTAAMEDKAMAMSMLCSFCHDLQADFLPYVKRSAEIMIPLLEHPHGEVQAHAIHSMPHLLTSAFEAHKQGKASIEFVQALLEAIVAQLVDVFPREGNAQTLQTLVTSLHDCIDVAGPLASRALTGKHLESVGVALFKLLSQSHERIARREALLKEEEEEGDLDEERLVEIEERNVGEDGLNAVVAACIEALVKSHQAAFIPVFDGLFPEIQRMLSVNMVASTRKIAVFIIDDVIEHLSGPELGAQGATKYFPHVLEAMCIYACDLNEEHGLRQAAAYGLGVAARVGGAAFTPFKAEIVRRLVASVQSDPTYLPDRAKPKFTVGRVWQPTNDEDDGESLKGTGGVETAGDSDEEGEEGEEGEEDEEGEEEDEEALDEKSRHSALDNLVSALGSIGVAQNEPGVLVQWLSFLPLRVDESEANTVYGQLLDLVEANSPALLGAQMERLPQVVNVLLQLVGTSMLKTAALRKRVVAFFRTLKAMPMPMLQQLASALPQNQQHKLSQLLASMQ